MQDKSGRDAGDVVIEGAYAKLLGWLRENDSREVNGFIDRWCRLWLDGLQDEWHKSDSTMQMIVTVGFTELALIEGGPGGGWQRPSQLDKAVDALDVDLDPAQQRFLRALAGTPMRLYQISRVNPGRSLVVVDLLAPDAPMQTIMEKDLSKRLQGGEVFAMRVVDLSTHRVKSKGHFPIMPQYVPTVVGSLQEWETSMPDVDLGNTQLSLAAFIGKRWCETMIGDEPLKILDEATGDPLAVITDVYQMLDAGALSHRMNAEREFTRTGQMTWVRFVAAPAKKSTSHGFAIGMHLKDGKAMGASIYPDQKTGLLHVFYQSDRMAAESRMIFESVAGETVKHIRRERKTTDECLREIQENPEGYANEADQQKQKVIDVLGADGFQKLFEQFYAEQYGNWADTALPALEGKTPREACITRSGEERVRAMIRMMEANELRLASQDGRKPVALKWLWTEVGIKPG
jgi:hypothetical protein